MFLRLVLLVFLWLLIRRIWRTYIVPRERPRSTRPPYPGPDSAREKKTGEMADFTQQKISDAEFEELDD
jgi:hypothetical protein